MILVKTSKGPEVTKLQGWLKAVGLNPGSIDGIFGMLTEEAVMQFQRVQGLKVDGIVGPITRAKFTEILTGKKPEPPKILPLAGRIFVLDAGHGQDNKTGKGDPGAVGKYSKEDDLAFEYTKALTKRLTDLGANVVLTRTGDFFVTLQDRVAIANKLKDADAFISIHLNSVKDRSVQGFSTLVYGKTGTGYRLAQKVVSEMDKAGVRLLGLGIFERPDLYVLKKTVVPAILLEMAFISNQAEEELANNPEYRAKQVEAVVSAVVSEFGRKIGPGGYKYEIINQGGNEIHLVTIKNPKLGVAVAPWGTAKKVSDLAKGTGAKLAINGGYFFTNKKTKVSVPVTPVIANGKSVGSRAQKQVAKRAVFCQYSDGSMEIKQVWGPGELAGVKHAIGAGPMIVSSGQAKVDASEKWAWDITSSKTSRSFVGLIDPNTLVLGVVTKKGGGITPEELAKFLVSRGVKKAMLFDGGGSSALWPKVSIEYRAVANVLLLY
ncbi:MAG: N-acetylmuramoyl-L-alanine amidase [Thermincolia bacterium]